jgi:hypothetical protein
VNARRVPEALQESLSSGVNALVAQTPTCLPTVETATTTSSDRVRGTGHGHGHGRGHGKKHGHGEGD